MTPAGHDGRERTRRWLDDHWDAVARQPRGGREAADWRRLVFEAGWAAPDWPEEWWGLALDKDDADAAIAEFARVGAPGAGQSRTNIVAHTIMAFGTDRLKRDVIPDYLVGPTQQCLLYSEPNAGSDLASLRTRAERQGDRYVVTGQKTWTSGARAAKYALLIARTDWDVPKHRGLSFFVLAMDQPGVDIRPIHQITGDSRFNEVFLDRATVPVDYRLGQEGEGWSILQSALAVERLVMGAGHAARTGGQLDLLRAARDAGKAGDPVVRQQMAQVLAWRELNALNMARGRAEAAEGGAAILATGKLAMSRILHAEARLARLILGAAAMLDGDDHARAAEVNYHAANAYMTSIGGGTDQIQRNIISERFLGLPREAEADRNIPFRESRAVVG